MLWLSDIQLPAAASGVRDARRVVDAADARLSPEKRDDVRLLVSEVATNAVRHGGPTESGVDPTIRVRLGVKNATIRVEVHDQGPGFRPRPRGRRAPLGSGWGVHLVHTLADTWGSGHDELGAWVMWFELALTPPDAADGAAHDQRALASMPAGPRSAAGSGRFVALPDPPIGGDALARFG